MTEGRYFINRRYPPVAFVSQVGEVTDAEQLAHLRELLELARADLAKNVRWVVVVDTRVSPPSVPVQRKQLWTFLKENSHTVRDASVAHIFIVDSVMMRGAITALRWLGALPRDIQTVADYDEAMERAKVELASKNMPPIPPELFGAGGERRALGDAHAFARQTKLRTSGT